MNVFTRIFTLIPVNLRGKCLLMLLLSFLGMCVEMLGAGLIIPVFGYALSPQKISENQIILGVFEQYNFSNLKVSLLLVAFVVFIYLLKSLYLSFLYWFQARFIFQIQANLSEKLFDIYLKQPYQFHINNNSGVLIRNVTTETVLLVEASLLSMMLIINEGIVIIGLCFLMLYLMPAKATSFILIIGLGALGIFYASRKKLLISGKKRQVNDGLKLQTAQEALNGIKDLKIFGKELFFLSSFQDAVREVSKASANRYAIQQLPRVWIEFLGILGILAIFLIDYLRGLDFASVFPSLAFFGVVTFRILPSLNRLVSSAQALKYSAPVVELFQQELSVSSCNTFEHNSLTSQKITFDNEIKVRRISFSHSGRNNLISDLSLNIKKGETIGLIGESGAGKSSFIDLLLGLHIPSHGDIDVDGKNIQENLSSWQKMIGYVPQNIFIRDASLAANIAFGVNEDEIDIARIDYALKSANLASLVEELPDGIHSMLGEHGLGVSGGQRQRIAIARALYRKPKILIMDESTSALDTKTENEVMASVYSLGSSVTKIIVAHRIKALHGCDKILLIDKGKISVVKKT